MMLGKDTESQTGTTLRALLRDPADPHAWKEFVERYAPRVLAWCRQWNLQPADAQDVTQEVLYRLVRQLRRFPYDPAKGHFRGWLKGVARHAWSDLRDSRRGAVWGSGDEHIQRLLEAQEDRYGLLETELAKVLRDQKGLSISAVVDGAGPKLEELIQWSTHPDVFTRIGSVEDFLTLLADVEDELTAPTETVVTDPLQAKRGDRLPNGFVVERILGQGATALAQSGPSLSSALKVLNASRGKGGYGICSDRWFTGRIRNGLGFFGFLVGPVRKLPRTLKVGHTLALPRGGSHVSTAVRPSRGAVP
jgi:RNA polymerase sigma factor (sigma-70 family)